MHQRIAPIIAIAALLLSGCRRLDAIASNPAVAPCTFLDSQPWVQVHIGSHSFIWGQPGSTIIVYFVGLFTIYTGYRFLSGTGLQKSQILWGTGLYLTGLGALCAGTSYQALGYEIKCAGREYCIATSWWEVAYMLLSVPGMNAFLIAGAYTSTHGKLRSAIIIYALINTVIYTALLLYGAIMPDSSFISFEFFILMSASAVLFLSMLHTISYRKAKSTGQLHLRNAWFIFIAVSVVYFLYQRLGITQFLWHRGIWCSANDVLHTGMICWVYYLLTRLRHSIIDVP